MHVHTYRKRLRVILDDKYEKAYLHEVMENQCQYSIMKKRNKLLKLLQILEDFSMEHLAPEKKSGRIRVKEDAKPIYLQPYPVPKVHKEMFKK